MFVFILSFAAYLLLAWGGEPFPVYEYVIGFVMALSLAIYTSGRAKSRRHGLKGLNPVRWGLFVVYIVGPFLRDLIKANINVALRIITGDIRPGIVKVDSPLKGSLARTLLANSITLTPGTLTVDLDEKTGDYYIHCIYVDNVKPSGEDVYGSFAKWIGRIAE